MKITGYPTEKNPALLERIIKASSEEGDIVLDCFNGSGTTIDVADKNNRKFIGIDNSSESIYHSLKRFVSGVEEMGDFVKRKSTNKLNQQTLFESSQGDKPKYTSRQNFNLISNANYINKISNMISIFGLNDSIDVI